MKELKEKLPAFLQDPNVLHLIAVVLGIVCFLVALNLPLVGVTDPNDDDEVLTVSVMDIISDLGKELEVPFKYQDEDEELTALDAPRGTDKFSEALTMLAENEMENLDEDTEEEELSLFESRFLYFMTKGILFLLIGVIGIVMGIFMLFRLLGAVLRLLRRKDAKRMGEAYAGTASIAVITLMFPLVAFILPVYEAVQLQIVTMVILVLMSAVVFLLEKMSYDFQD